MNTKDQVLNIFSNLFNLPENQIDMKFTKKDIESWDSIGHLSLIMRLEEEFQIKLTTDEIVGINDIENCIKIIDQKLNAS